MYGRMAAPRRHLGQWLALIALSMRLIAPAINAPALPEPTNAAELVLLFGAHALCLSQDASEPSPAPADGSGPHKIDHRFGACCFWHCNASLHAPTPTSIEPLAFLFSGVSFPAPTQIVIAARLSGLARARAPPREA
jgi:hypothetical protein